MGAAQVAQHGERRRGGCLSYLHAEAVGEPVVAEASILIASNLLEAEVPNIWAKAISRQHGQILERLGVHHVVLPEHEMGERVAHLVTGRMLDFIEFDDDYALVKTVAPAVATGMPLGESQVRSKVRGDGRRHQAGGRGLHLRHRRDGHTERGRQCTVRIV